MCLPLAPKADTDNDSNSDFDSDFNCVSVCATLQLPTPNATCNT